MSSPASTIRASTRRAAPPGRPSSGSAKPPSIWRALVAGRFSVVTTLARSVPAIEHNLAKYGLASRCARVRASDVAVLELELPGSDARGKISAEIGRAISDDKAEAIVLGCAGMADLADELSREHGVPVLDGVACAVRLAETVAALGLRTSKVGGYAWPRPKRLAGIYAAFSPQVRNNASAGLTTKRAQCDIPGERDETNPLQTMSTLTIVRAGGRPGAALCALVACLPWVEGSNYRPSRRPGHETPRG